MVAWQILLCLLASTQAIKFLVSREQEVCIYENLPKNEELVTQIIVDPEARDFDLTVLHLNEKGRTIDQKSTKLHNSLDVTVHQEDSPVYVCVMSNTTTNLSVELIPNLMLPEFKSFPTADDADRLQRHLFVVNSKFLQLINQQTEFEHKEQQGLEANLRVESSLKHMLMVELGIIMAIGLGQYLIMRGFVNKIKQMY